MTYLRPQPIEDAYECEQWFAPFVHFQDVTMSEDGMSAPAPNQATGRMRNIETLRYLSNVGIIDNVRESTTMGYTYSQVVK